MSAAGEAIRIALTLAGSWAVIEIIDWVGRNKDEALGTGLDDYVPDEMKAAAKSAGGGLAQKDSGSQLTGAHSVRPVIARRDGER